MLSIAVASLSFNPPSQIAGAASVSVDPPSQIVLKDALFHVQNYFDGGLFAVGDRHMVSGTASLSGGDLTVKCGSGATGKACPATRSTSALVRRAEFSARTLMRLL